jgi:sulfur relay (sulfurtransferase) DsrF/TusC family protein
MSTYEIIEIALLLLACYACYQAGVKRGIEETVDLVIDSEIITADDFNKLLDKKIDELK